MEGGITMSVKEISRIEVVSKVLSKHITGLQAAETLGLSVRQVRRLIKKYKKNGPKGLISKKRGSRGNHRLLKATKDLAISLIKQHYSDFGPTLAHEKLTESHGLKISVGSVRSIMIEEELWIPKKTKKKRIFQYRERRSKFGELMQMDGSHHAWFEERGPKCALIFTLDDATGTIPVARFEPSETTWGYFDLLEEHVTNHGRPLALYTDKHGVFRVNHKNALSGNGITQFGRAMKELDIKIIYANTPQAKGRIERMNQTLQDRLVKELRLQQISTLEEANAFLPTFLENFNQRFAIVPKDPANAHRDLLPEHNLENIFTIKEHRTLSKNLTFQHKNVIYQVITEREAYIMRNAKIVIEENQEGEIKAIYKGKRLFIKRFLKQERQMDEIDSKRLNHVVDEIEAKRSFNDSYKPSKRHPWRRYPKKLELVGN